MVYLHVIHAWAECSSIRRACEWLYSTQGGKEGSSAIRTSPRPSTDFSFSHPIVQVTTSSPHFLRCWHVSCQLSREENNDRFEYDDVSCWFSSWLAAPKIEPPRGKSSSKAGGSRSRPNASKPRPVNTLKSVGSSDASVLGLLVNGWYNRSLLVSSATVSACGPKNWFSAPGAIRFNTSFWSGADKSRNVAVEYNTFPSQQRRFPGHNPLSLCQSSALMVRRF